jgi:hypothetical protein
LADPIVLKKTDMADPYAEYPVQPALQSAVVCTWTDESAADQHGVVLPDACIDIAWDGEEIFVAGPDTGPAPISSQSTFVGIRFRPGSAPRFLGVPASELAGYADQAYLTNECRRLAGATPAQLVRRQVGISANGYN